MKLISSIIYDKQILKFESFVKEWDMTTLKDTHLNCKHEEEAI